MLKKLSTSSSIEDFVDNFEKNPQMGSIAVYGNLQFIIVRLPKSRQRSMIRVHFEGFRRWESSGFCFSASFSFQKPSSKLKFLAKAAASASSFPPVSGAGAGYSEQLIGAKPNKKTQRIAGTEQEEIEDPTLLADPDSCFCEFNGVQFHHKICDSEFPPLKTLEEGTSSLTERVSFPLIMLHGFGSSVFSWNRVMKPLAQIMGSKVLAFDRPAFGLTSRVNAIKHSSMYNKDGTPLNPYSLMFSMLATLFFINFLASEKVILVGHSGGSLVAVDTYFEAPERVAALILVAPAIAAPFFKRSVRKYDQAGIDNLMKGNNSNSTTPVTLFLNLCNILVKFTKYIADTILSIVKWMGVMVNSLYKKSLSAILRSSVGVMLIRIIIDKFGIPAIRASWCDPNQVSDTVLRGYTKPLKIKGWDKALVEYTVAALTDKASNLKPPLAERLKYISCPVLIITGDTDRLVPAWNAERLSRAIPGSCLEIIGNCGHLPQEEKAEEFVSIVDKFLQRVFGTAQAPRLQVVI